MNAISHAEFEELKILRQLDITRSKDKFVNYYQRMSGFWPEKHHRVICSLLQSMEDDKLDRAMVFVPPRMAKSTLCTQLFPSWLIGKHPKTNIMTAVHTQNFANKIGKIVRNHVKSPLYPFDTQLAPDSQAKNQWSTTAGGEYNGFGLMGGSTHGNPADWLIMDDLIKGRKMALSPHMREEAWETYKADLHSRLQGRRKQLMVTCMTGDTPVLMADGRDRNLRDVRAGDHIATYENGGVSTSTILNFANKGSDFVYEIRMSSGRVVRANARHPFLVRCGGKTEWRRTASLKKGNVILTVTGGSGAAKSVHGVDATLQPSAEVYACPTTAKNDGQMGTDPHQSIVSQGAKPECGADTVLASRNITSCSCSSAACALFARSHPEKTSAPTGVENCASTTAMTREKSEASYATTATSQSATVKTRKPYSLPLDMFAVTDDVIVDISDGGYEDVFDIEVDRTENFIANGLVSHNTRWHEDDVCGRILPEGFDGTTGWYEDRETGERWFVLSIPAQAEHAKDPIGRKIGEWLWPSQWGEKAWGSVKMRGGYVWSALYQQRPSPEEGLFFKDEQIKEYNLADLDLAGLNIYITSDYAVTAEAGATDPDYTVHTVWGIDSEFNIYMLDMWRGRTTSDVWVNEFIRLVKLWKPFMAGEEDGQILKGVGPFLQRQLTEEGVFVYRKQYTSSTKKEQRAQSLLGMAALGRFYLPRGHPMTSLFRTELLAFPAGKHDDMVDTGSLLARMLADILSGKKKDSKDSPHGESLNELFKRMEEES